MHLNGLKPGSEHITIPLMPVDALSFCVPFCACLNSLGCAALRHAARILIFGAVMDEDFMPENPTTVVLPFRPWLITFLSSLFFPLLFCLLGTRLICWSTSSLSAVPVKVEKGDPGVYNVQGRRPGCSEH